MRSVLVPEKWSVYERSHFSLSPDICMCLFLNRVGSLSVFPFCGLAEISGGALRTLWLLAMIMFCVSHVRISKRFIKNMSALTG